MKRVLYLGAVVFLSVFGAGCGQTFRLIIFSNPPEFPNPAAAHTAITISDNGTFTNGSAMVVDVSGDSVVSTKTVGLRPVYGLHQSAAQVLVVNQSVSGMAADSVSKLNFFGTVINAVSVISLPTSYDPKSGSPTTSFPNFVASTEPGQAYVLLPGYQPNPKGSAVTPSVAVLNTVSDTPTVILPVGNNPVAMAETLDQTKLYVANQGDSTISAFNTRPALAPRQLCVNGSCPSGSTPLKLSSPPIWIVARSDNQRVYVLEANGAVAYIDTHTTAGPDNLFESYSPQTVQVPGAAYMWYDMILNRLYVPGGNVLAVVDVSQSVPATLAAVPLPAFPVLPSGSAPVAAAAVSVTSLPDGSRAYVTSVPSTPDMVLSTQATITSVSGDGTNATYTYTLNSGHDVVTGATVTITGTGQAGFDGTFPIASVLNGTSACPTTCFQVFNATMLGATAVNAAATGNNIFPQVTVVTTSSNTIETTIGIPAIAPYDAFCSPAQNAQAPRFRFSMSAGGDSSRVYLAGCDGGNVNIINTSTDTFWQNTLAPTSGRNPVPPSTANPPQNPVLIFAGP